jgi:O-Antigen ligase
MDSPDTAQAAAILGALGAALALLAGSRLALLAGFALLAAAELGLAIGSLGLDGFDRLTAPAAVAGGAAGAPALAAGTAALVRWPVAVTPLVLAAAPFRLPLNVDTSNRFLFDVAKSGELGRLLPLYVVLAAASLALVARTVLGEQPAVLPRMVAVPAAALTGYAAVSLLWSQDLEAGANTLAFFLLPFVALVAVVGRAPFTSWLPRVLAIIAVALAGIFAVIGIWQAATKELLFFAPNLEVANTYAPIFRVTSLFRDPSLYGRHVVLGIAVLVVVLLLGRVNLPLAVGLIAVLFTGLYFSYSQSSLAALFVVVLAIATVTGDRRVRIGAAGVAALLLVVGAAIVIREVQDTSLRRATSDRSRRVELTARVLADHPLAGVGLGGQPLASQRLSERFGPKPNFVSHSTPLTVGAELGVVGIALYAALLAGSMLMIVSVWRLDAGLGLVLGASLLALFVHSLFYSGFFEDPITWFVLGLGSSFLVARQTAAEPAATMAPSRAAAAAR